MWGQAAAAGFKTLPQNYFCRMVEGKNRRCRVTTIRIPVETGSEIAEMRINCTAEFCLWVSFFSRNK